MRKIITSTFASLDGYIDNPQDWTMGYMNEEGMAIVTETTFGSDALIFGRLTFEGMAQAWPARAGDPFADYLNRIPKYAVSSTLTPEGLAAWDNSTLIDGADLIPEVTKLKQQPGKNIMTWGTGRLTDALMENGLLDEYHIWLFPVVRGGGQPLFRDGVSATLDLVGSKQLGNGTMVLTYRPQNAITD